MWLPGPSVARAASVHLTPGATSVVRGPSSAARSVARWLTRHGFIADPESPGAPTTSAEVLVLLGRLDETGAGEAAKSLRDGGRLVACRVRRIGRRRAMELTAWLARAGFVGIGQGVQGGLFPVHTTFGTFRRLPDERRDPG